MDNIGGTGANSRENVGFSGAPENTPPNTEAVNSNEFLGTPEANEMPNAPTGEQLAEEQVPMPEQPKMTEVALPPLTVDLGNAEVKPDEAPAMEELRKINIPRDAERLPKEYAVAFAKVVEEDKRDPHQLVEDVKKSRWDLLEKAYGRKLGDGLNGGGVAK
jgi:hypothetical protein